MLITVIAGTSTQLGTLSMRANRPTSGMFITSRITLPINSEAIRPQTTSGCCSNSSGPGVMLYRVRAPIITAVVPEPGTPRVSMGISEPQAAQVAVAELAAWAGHAFFSHISHGAGDGCTGTWQYADNEAGHSAAHHGPEGEAELLEVEQQAAAGFHGFLAVMGFPEHRRPFPAAKEADPPDHKRDPVRQTGGGYPVRDRGDRLLQ